MELALGMDAPVGRGAELGTVDYHVFDIAVAVDALDKRDPGQVGRAQAEVERRVDVDIKIGLFEEQLCRLGGAVIGEVSGDIGREGVVELVVDRDVKALDVEARSIVRLRGTTALVVDIAEVGIHPAADLGVVPPARLGI